MKCNNTVCFLFLIGKIDWQSIIYSNYKKCNAMTWTTAPAPEAGNYVNLGTRKKLTMRKLRREHYLLMSTAKC